MKENHNYIAQKQAVTWRDKWGISKTDPLFFKSLLPELKVLAVFKPLSDRFSGMALKIDENRFMMVNSKDALGRQRFTVCHELYHLFVQQDFTSMACVTGKFNHKEPIEYQADLFASYLLIPAEGMLELIPESQLRSKNQITLKTILSIEQHYRCSRSALVIRLFQMGLIDNSSYMEDLKKSVKKSARQYGYSEELYTSANENLVIGDYGILAKSLYDNEKLSEMHYITLMDEIGIDVLKEDIPNGEV